MNFQVPQFIEEKPKIVGFLTLGQFFYIAGAFGIAFIAFFYLKFFLDLFFSVIVGSLAAGLAFGKIHGQPLPKVLEAALSYYWSPRTYTWQRALSETALDVSSVEKIEAIRRNMSIQQKLKAIALGITTSRLLSPKQFRAKEKSDKGGVQVVRFMTGEQRLAKRIDYRG
ncbi:PrgI family protein [Candidatus Jorgensenbacteria bacterium]|nr:PrgI family protein [Candidatus Jorgensenbacteria bacterium]